MVASLVSSFLVGFAFLLLGRLRMTVIVGFIPSNVVCGFLSCIGYKVLKASVEVACPVGKPLKLKYLPYFFGTWEESWKFILPALPIGVPLYLLKRYHIGRPTLNFPLFIIGPALIFYAALAMQARSAPICPDLPRSP
jgi:SulP family sulfate permease